MASQLPTQGLEHDPSKVLLHVVLERCFLMDPPKKSPHEILPLSISLHRNCRLICLSSVFYLPVACFLACSSPLCLCSCLRSCHCVFPWECAVGCCGWRSGDCYGKSLCAPPCLLGDSLGFTRVLMACAENSPNYLPSLSLGL